MDNNILGRKTKPSEAKTEEIAAEKHHINWVTCTYKVSLFQQRQQI